MKKYLLIWTALFFWSALCQAQTPMKGRVADMQGEALGGVKISVNGGAFVESDPNGNFEFDLAEDDTPREINVLKEGMRLAQWDVNNDQLNILVQFTPFVLTGRVINHSNKPVVGVRIAVAGIGDISSKTDSRGSFILILPGGTKINGQTRLTADGIRVSKEDAVFFDNYTFVSLKTRASPKVRVSQVIVYDENVRPVSGVDVLVNGIMYKTNATGEFAIKNGGTEVGKDPAEFVMEDGYEVLKIDYVNIDNYMYLHIRTNKAGAPIGSLDSTLLNYTQNFNQIFNRLELEKQLQSEKSKQLQDEIEDVTNKLEGGGLSDTERAGTQTYLNRLKRMLVENEVAYEDTHSKIKGMLSKMKSHIEEKDSLHSLANLNVQRARSQQQKAEEDLNRNLVISVVVTVFLLILAGVFYNISKKMGRQKNELEEKVDEIHQKNDEMQAQAESLREVNEEIQVKNEALEQQKGMIEAKNMHITASINYAQRIQSAMLPDSAKIRKRFPDSFVLFKPRDIVSGDFYWYAEKLMPDGSTKTIMAAADCTGHGVPGAFMSMVGDSLLNQIVKLQGITAPDLILTELNRGIRATLRQAENTNRDGMDIALCVIDPESKTVDFAGAKNPLIYVQGGILREVKGTRQSIGGLQVKRKNFSRHAISFEEKPMTCYIFSDGYQDQFGGEANTKFMKKNLHRLLLRVHKKPFAEQKQILDATIEDWMRGRTQIDDILVIGFRLSELMGEHSVYGD